MQFKWVPPKIDTTLCTFEWGADYATEVHNGIFGEVTARPWVYTTVLKYFDVAEELKANLKETGNVNRAFINTSVDLSEAFSTVMRLPIFNYPTTTVRSDGSVVTSPRSIKDTGDLIASQTYFFS
jgi:hypothetical protein